MSPAEAIQRINESVTVEMTVRATKNCTCSKQVFMDSEFNKRDPNNLGLIVTEFGLTKFQATGVDDPTEHFKGKSIRVRGVVIRKDERPYIEISEPNQIEVVS
jgi:hypothetical protein